MDIIEQKATEMPNPSSVIITLSVKQIKSQLGKSASTRFTLHKTATNKDVGPGRYEEKRTCFPVIDRNGVILPEEKKKCKPLSIFKSHSPRISPLQLSDAPLPGKYYIKTLAEEVVAKKNIGRNGQFFTRSPKLPDVSNTVHS